MFSYDPYAELATLRDFAPLTLTSTDIAHGQPLPRAQWGSAGGGADTSPQLSWSGAPEGTRSYALSCFDPDAPTGSGYWHWAVYDIPADVTSFAAGRTEAGIALKNEAGVAGYIGAAPPPGTGLHRYFFVVDALDVESLDLPDGATPAVLGFNRHFHSLARGILVPTATND
ncbi:YbhB/YbcL family Raf kinase inhibitor-like protein [Microbacterium marinilacus]|uniref:YbhB/YbcL family Raf kinase inhibitor-like protein n=1 Tax=Microbacterium marinilacus TaxID=415209 RepID=A0ABP7BGP6_9MICO|nr:YbhB/YbcL family Raf kinase inhibitor-like protein [Microbacterium marinilacus]MBY0690325.1 YbhB/YbcL family Raf kinase inhibitor-like protein [Microbacterium marinilacus]